MLGRIRRTNERNAPDDEPSIQGVGSLLGGDVASLLDGESVVLPSDDDMSSIHTNTVHGDDNSINHNGNRNNQKSHKGAWMMGGIATARAAEEYKDDGDSVAGGDAAGGGAAGRCVPSWLANAPKWLKIAIVASTALLVGAIVLVAVAATLNVGTGTTSAKSVISPTSPPQIASAVPSLTPSRTKTKKPTTRAPTTRGPSPAPSLLPTTAPTTAPTETPVQSTTPTDAATIEPSASDSETPTTPGSTKTVFYLTGGRPQGSTLSDFQNFLPELPQDGEFLVNLGDWNSPFTTNCDEASFQEVDALYQDSSVPVFFVPGDNEYNDCPSPDQAYALWKQYLVGYETKYWPDQSWSIEHYDGVLEENWAFVLKNILFVGINLVGGTVQDSNEWATRQAANLDWIQLQFDNASQSPGGIDLLVVMGHADPLITTNEPFFDPFFQLVRTQFNVPTIFAHRNLGIDSAGAQENYDGIADFVLLTVQGAMWPPMRVEVDTELGSFDWNQADWFTAN